MSTRAVQSEAQASLPSMATESSSFTGFAWLRSSLPILSLYLLKNRCSTIVSVSSAVVPSHSSESSSAAAAAAAAECF